MALGDGRSDFVSQNCPTVVFHESEQFFPCSVDHLLKDSSLIRRRRGVPDGTNDFHVGDATLQELATYLNDDQYENFLDIFPTQYSGHAPVGGIVNAPVYIAFVETEDLFVDVYYIFLYAYQGSQTFRCTPPIAKHFNCIAREYGRHQGDLEHFIVRTDPSFSAVLSVAYEAHGQLAWYFPGDASSPCPALPAGVTLIKGEGVQCAAGDYPVQDGHPLVYASLLNHGNYFLEQPTRQPGHTEERGRPVRQQWFVTHQVNTIEVRPCLALSFHQMLYHHQQISTASPVTCLQHLPIPICTLAYIIQQHYDVIVQT